MIPKKGNSTWVDKLRKIMLFEYDWNLLNKIIGTRTMASAEANMEQLRRNSMVVVKRRVHYYMPATNNFFSISSGN